MNWRSTTPPEVIDDVDSLTEDSVEAAADFLSRRGSFTPFMLTIALDGNRELRGLGSPLPGQDEEAIVRALQMSDDVSKLRACACVIDVVAHEPVLGDAIKIKIEHRAGFCSDLVVPYRVSAETLDVDMNSANAAAASPLLWGRAGLADDEGPTVK